MSLGFLHSKGIVHRDLKMENVLIDEDGYIKLIDFGLATLISEEKQQSVSFCGTPEYFAPEMVNKTGHDKSLDWWTLGVIVYEMLFGQTPFFSKNKIKMYKKITEGQPAFPDRDVYRVVYSDEIMDLI
jgi:serine/threonine protein kinase